MDTTDHQAKALIQLGLTPPKDCNYLSGEQEQVLVLMDNSQLSQGTYSQLIKQGFRRSGEQVYRPHCQSCQECQSVRVDARQFKLSKSQKRVLKTNEDLSICFTNKQHENSYPLFESYIAQKHADGSMYPASVEQFNNFLSCSWLTPTFMEIYLEEALIGIAVCDSLDNAMSAVYFYYDPCFDKRSLGVFAILKQLQYLKANNQRYLYLGYQIDDCVKMNYKTKFKAYQRLIAKNWQLFE